MGRMDSCDDAVVGVILIAAGCALIAVRIGIGEWHYRGGVTVERWQSTAGASLCFALGAFFVVRAIVRKLRK